MIDYSNYSFKHEDVIVEVTKSETVLYVGGTEVKVTHKPTMITVQCIGDIDIPQKKLINHCLNRLETMLSAMEVAK